MAVETVSEGLSPLAFYLIFITILIIASIIFFIKRLEYDRKEILRSIIFSLITTIIIEIVVMLPLSILSVTTISCMPDQCPSLFSFFFASLPYTFIGIFLLTLLGYYIVKIITKNFF